MTIDELIPSISPLSHSDKFRLLQLILQQLEQEKLAASQAIEPVGTGFDPKCFYGSAHISRTDVNQYLAEAREGWN